MRLYVELFSRYTHTTHKLSPLASTFSVIFPSISFHCWCYFVCLVQPKYSVHHRLLEQRKFKAVSSARLWYGVYILTVDTSIQPKNRVAHCFSSSRSFHSPSRYHSYAFTLFRTHTRERTSSSACCFCSILFSFSSNARHCHHRRRRRRRRLLAKHNWYVCVATHFECTHYISTCLWMCMLCV